MNLRGRTKGNGTKAGAAVVRSQSISVDELADDQDLSAKDLEQQRIRGGFNLAWGVIGLIVAALMFVAVFAVATFPSQPDGLDAEEIRAWANLRTDWFASVKDLLQTLIVSLLIPLLATLIGYIFGRGPNGDGTR